MSELRELAEAELDLVTGGAVAAVASASDNAGTVMVSATDNSFNSVLAIAGPGFASITFGI